MRWCGSALRCAALVGFLVVAHTAIVGQALPGGATVVTEQTHGDVNLKVGAVLEVRLEANHTTGYSWIFAPAVSPILMRQGRTTYQEHGAGSNVGEGGVEVWRFKAIKAGKQGLQFEYRRPWEKGSPPAKVVTFTVTVD